MKLAKNIALYSLIIITFILMVNLAVSYFVSLPTPTMFKVSGELNTWILFNGAVIGSLVGGLIAGIIAYNISKLQIEKEQENYEKTRKYELKNKLRLETILTLLDYINSYLDDLYTINRFIINLMSQTSEYKKLNSEKTFTSDETYKKMREYFKLNYDKMFEASVRLYDTQMKINHIYSSHRIMIYDYKDTFEKIFIELIDVNKCNNIMKEIFSKIYYKMNYKFLVDPENIDKLLTNYSDFNDVANKVNYSMKCFSIDLQNSLSPIFDIVLEKPEYEKEI